MRFTLLFLLALPAAAVAGDPPTLEIPTGLKAAGGYVSFVPKGTAKAVTYVGLSGADPLPAELLKDARTFLLPVGGLKAGRYHFSAVAALDNQQTRVDFSVDVGEVPPDPGPKPGPDPKPPAPGPDTPLRAKLRAAYTADAGDPAAKESARKDLVALYRQAAALAADPSVTTTGELAQRVRAAGQILAPGQLAGLRKAVGAEVGAVFPADVPLTDESRTAAAKLFGAIADAINW